jgi:hypothetical protein
MKAIRLILLILIVGGAGLLGYRHHNSTKQKVNPDVTYETRELCYIWNTQEGDTAKLVMAFSGEGGSQVEGSFDYYPVEKDSKSGVFTGTAGPLDRSIMARTATLWWEVSSEGTTLTEELSVIFGDGSASIGFGEMKKKKKGVYVYADRENISYALDMWQTDCEKL